MKPLALDLECGKGGWTIGLLKVGWDVIGVDNFAWEGYPARRIIKDVRLLTVDDIKALDQRPISLVVASPPCQEFSYRSFPFKRCVYLRDNVPPDKTIWETNIRIAKEWNAPLILENVRGAERYMGKAKIHYGAFYLWGDVPALIPYGNPRKGFTNQKEGFPSGQKYRTGKNKGEDRKALWKNRTEMHDARKNHFTGECEGDRGKARKNLFKDGDIQKRTGSKSSIRKEWSAKIAMIPEELSEWIGNVFYPKNKQE